MNRDNGRILRACNGPSTQGRSHLLSDLVHWPLEIEQGQWATKPTGAERTPRAATEDYRPNPQTHNLSVPGRLSSSKLPHRFFKAFRKHSASRLCRNPTTKSSTYRTLTVSPLTSWLRPGGAVVSKAAVQLFADGESIVDGLCCGGRYVAVTKNTVF